MTFGGGGCWYCNCSEAASGNNGEWTTDGGDDILEEDTIGEDDEAAEVDGLVVVSVAGTGVGDSGGGTADIEATTGVAAEEIDEGIVEGIVGGIVGGIVEGTKRTEDLG